MALFNYATRELSAQVVYYGPGLSGKTTNIEMVHKLLNPEQKGRLISLPTETDRTLFFDFLPLDLGQIKGFRVRFHLYTVPGQVFYNATRRLVLQGVDGVVFVADSQVDMMGSNIESLNRITSYNVCYTKLLRSRVRVLVTYDFRFSLPVWFGINIPLASTSEMVVITSYSIHYTKLYEILLSIPSKDSRRRESA